MGGGAGGGPPLGPPSAAAQRAFRYARHVAWLGRRAGGAAWRAVAGPGAAPVGGPTGTKAAAWRAAGRAGRACSCCTLLIERLLERAAMLLHCKTRLHGLPPPAAAEQVAGRCSQFVGEGAPC